MRRFDRKFGVDFLRELPETPGVYLFKDEAGAVLYAGKARNLRRRLAGYRNASRRKAHRKMRTLVREAHSLEVRLQQSEADALLLENELIRTLRPPYNVDGAYDFLYPSIGTGRHEGRLLLCFTSRPESFDRLPLRWHGCFRSRLRALDAFLFLVPGSDGTCRAVCDAMAFAVPVVSTRRGILPELLAERRRGEVPGYAVEETPAALGAALIRLLQDDALRAAVGAAALRRTQRDMDPHAAAERTAALYQELLEERS